MGGRGARWSTVDRTRVEHQGGDAVTESFRLLLGTGNSPRFWITQCGVLFVMTIHTLLRLAGEPTPLTASLMLIPVLYAALAFGVTGAFATASWATALFAVHWLFLRSEPASNTHVWIELVNLAVLMASGIFVGQRVEVAQAALRRTEAALQLAAVAEARYRSLFEDQPSPVIVTDSHDVVTELNTAARGLLGSAAVGRVLGDSLGLTRAELFLKEWPVTVRSAAGAVRNYVPTAHEIDVGDGSVLVQIVLADVTDQCRRQEEQRAFTGRVLQIQEEERLRLARELHDDPLQQLMYLARTLEEIAEDPLLAERLVDLVGKGRLIARSASTAVRTWRLGLRPPMLADPGHGPARAKLDTEPPRAGRRGVPDHGHRVRGRGNLGVGAGGGRRCTRRYRSARPSRTRPQVMGAREDPTRVPPAALLRSSQTAPLRVPPALAKPP